MVEPLPTADATSSSSQPSRGDAVQIRAASVGEVLHARYMKDDGTTAHPRLRIKSHYREFIRIILLIWLHSLL